MRERGGNNRVSMTGSLRLRFRWRAGRDIHSPRSAPLTERAVSLSLSRLCLGTARERMALPTRQGGVLKIATHAIRDIRGAQGTYLSHMLSLGPGMHLDFAFAQVEQALGPRKMAEAAELIGRGFGSGSGSGSGSGCGSGSGSGSGTDSLMPLSRTSLRLRSVPSGVLDVGVQELRVRGGKLARGGGGANQR